MLTGGNAAVSVGRGETGHAQIAPIPQLLLVVGLGTKIGRATSRGGSEDNGLWYDIECLCYTSSLPLGELSAENVDNILCDEEVSDSTFRKLGTQLN